MTDVYFCRTGHHYQTYDDFFRLAELAGYPIIHIAELDPEDATKTYICTPLSGEWHNGWPNAKARIIHWDLEWRLDGTYPQTPGVREVWASDGWYAGKIGARYVVLGSDARLVGYKTDSKIVGEMWVQVFEPKHTSVYDIALMMYREPHRRMRVIQALQMTGLKIAPNAWGLERHNALMSSTAMLHIHQHDGVRTIAPQRWAIAAAYKLPLITENVNHVQPFGYERMLTIDYDNIPLFTRDWVQRNDGFILQRYGETLHQLLCEDMTFRKCVEAAL